MSVGFFFEVVGGDGWFVCNRFFLLEYLFVFRVWAAAVPTRWYLVRRALELLFIFRNCKFYYVIFEVGLHVSLMCFVIGLFVPFRLLSIGVSISPIVVACR